MKKIIITILLTLLLPMGLVRAHAPSEINVSYSTQEEELTLEVTHGVTNIDQHYIKLITITQKDKPVKKIYIYRQDTVKGFTRVIPLKAKVGEELIIKMYCANRGEKQISFIIPAEESSDDDQ